MPRTPKGTPPAYRRHASGQAVVTVRTTDNRRQDILLGPHNSPESHQQYGDVLAKLRAHGGRYPVPGAVPDPDAITVNELALAFWRAQEAKRGKDDRELRQFKYVLRPLRLMYGSHAVAQFTPKCLRAVLMAMADGSWLTDADRAKYTKRGRKTTCCRSVLNRRLSRLKFVFSWGVTEELIPAGVAHALREVKGLRAGEDKRVRESDPVEPAFWEDVKAALPYCTKPVGTMLQLQWLTGMRSGEVRVMRTLDLDRSDPACWLYKPGSDAGEYGKHKNAWRRQLRVVPLGPQCIDLLKPWLREDEPAAYLFAPWRAVQDRNQKRRAEGKKTRSDAKLQRLRKKKPKRAPRGLYSDNSYAHAVARACAKAGVSFTPYALRHGRKMDLEREYGSEAARCVLGQKSIEATQHYGNIDIGRAADVMKRHG